MPHSTGCGYTISIHALREEGDAELLLADCWGILFLSTPSARRATRPLKGVASKVCYFYPRPPRGGRRGGSLTMLDSLSNFYPRPPRGGRQDAAQRISDFFNFYPRPPRGGRPISLMAASMKASKFLSTPSARRATCPAGASASTTTYFYPRPPRGGRPGASCAGPAARLISIHALREEGDRTSRLRSVPARNFYPRPPRGGRPSCPTTRRH